MRCERGRGFRGDRARGGGVDAFGSFAGQFDHFRTEDAIGAHEGHFFQPDVSALLDEARRFGVEAAAVDQLRTGFSHFAQEGLEVGIADGDRIGSDDLATQCLKVGRDDADEAFTIGAAVMDGGQSRYAQLVVDEFGGEFALVGIRGDGAVEASEAALGEGRGGAAGADGGETGGVVDGRRGRAGGRAHRPDYAHHVRVRGVARGDSDAAFRVALRILRVEGDGEFRAAHGDCRPVHVAEHGAVADVVAEGREALAAEGRRNANDEFPIRRDDDFFALRQGEAARRHNGEREQTDTELTHPFHDFLPAWVNGPRFGWTACAQYSAKGWNYTHCSAMLGSTISSMSAKAPSCICQMPMGVEAHSPLPSQARGPLRPATGP